MDRSSDLIHAVRKALRAPSVHNTQPWLWRIGPDTAELFADTTRHLSTTDPDRRDLIVSCGAALHHLRVALAAFGCSVEVDLIPDPENARHLATVRLTHGAADHVSAELFAAIDRRRTDRRRMGDRRLSPELLEQIQAHARHAGAALLPVRGSAARQRLTAALLEAGRRQESAPGYAAELQLWTHRYGGALDGVPPANRPQYPTGPGPSPLRRFPQGQLLQPPMSTGRTAGDAAELLAIVTPGDDVTDRLRAGEAASAALLAATGLGLASTPLSQGLENADMRAAIQSEILHVPEPVQLVIRLGWPATGAPELPPTPRRDLESVLLRN